MVAGLHNGPCANDFIAKSQSAAEAEYQTKDGQTLCCCEYRNENNERFHILGCCCDCLHFDRFFTDLVTCRRIDLRTQRGMLLTFQDRLRIPWRGGAKQVSPATLVPIVALPLAIALAAVNVYLAAVMVLSCGIFIGYAYHYVQRRAMRTRFFSMWLFWSIVYMAVLFQFTVPLLELLPEEDLILVLLTSAALFCLWRTRQRASLNHVVQSSVAKDDLPDITEASAAEEEEAAAQTALLLEDDGDELVTVGAGADGGGSRHHHQPNICAGCRKYVAARTAHCGVCGACIMRRDHHSYWLDCCVGERNHIYYLGGLVLGELALLLGANLTLTAVCHPFLVVRFVSIPLMLPDDCSEVFDDYELGISFVIAVYALLIAVYILIVLFRQIYLISRGLTMLECQRGQGGNRKSYWSNWRSFLF